MKEIYKSEKNKYFLKDKKCEIYKIETVIDEFDNHRGEPVFIGSYWCYTRQLSMTQLYEAARYGTKEERIFVINYNENTPKIGYLVRYRGDWYEIIRVDTQDDYKTDIFLYCKRSNYKGL